jgi:hypothetical protein
MSVVLLGFKDAEALAAGLLSVRLTVERNFGCGAQSAPLAGADLDFLVIMRIASFTLFVSHGQINSRSLLISLIYIKTSAQMGHKPP